MTTAESPANIAPVAGARATARATETVGGRRRSDLAVGAAGVLGGGLIVAGALAPWLSLYAGLQPIAGTDGQNGRALLAMGAVALAAGARHLLAPGAATRWILGALGFLVTAYSTWLAIGLLGLAGELAAQPLLVGRLEPGLALAVAGGALAFGTMFLPADARDAAPSHASPLRYLLGGALLVAGAVHLVLAPEHGAEAPWLGASFVMSGLIQLGLAVAVLAGTPGRQRLLAIAATSVVFVAAYGVSVTAGLPVPAHGHEEAAVAADHDAHGLGTVATVTGDADHHVEPVSEAGVATVGAELFAAGAAIVLLRRRREAAAARDEERTSR